MKIAYITTYDALDKSTWPKYSQGNYGSNLHIYQSLCHQGFSLQNIGSLKNNLSFVTRPKWSFYRNIIKKDYYRWTEPLVCKSYAHQVDRQVKNSDYDLLLCPEGCAPVAYLKSNQPLVLWLDTILAALIDSYPYLSNLCWETKKHLYMIEQKALERASLVIFASEWAAQKAIDIYNVDVNKIVILPRGANLEIEPGRTLAEIKSLVNSRSIETCKLTYIGIDWQRKGGDVALEVSKNLRNMGLDVELNIIGDLPNNQQELPSFVNPIGYINKADINGRTKFYELLAKSHFLILPTRADVTPNVLIEANAFGVPCLTTNIAGIPSIITDDRNGKIFELDTNPLEYAEYIFQHFSEYDKYISLSLSTFSEYVNRLNWAAIGKQASDLFWNLV
jgi:glycosyltransferase involved in cell wall biosynthesis